MLMAMSFKVVLLPLLVYTTPDRCDEEAFILSVKRLQVKTPKMELLQWFGTFVGVGKSLFFNINL